MRIEKLAVAVLGVAVAAAAFASGCTINDAAYRDEGQAFVDAAIPAIAANWNADALIKEADPQFLEALPEPKARQMIADLSRELGPLKQVTPVVATVGYNVGSWFGKGAQYVSTLDCEKGKATLVVVARKRGDAWRILGFHVNIHDSKQRAVEQ
jgi:hypothetical protein